MVRVLLCVGWVLPTTYQSCVFALLVCVVLWYAYVTLRVGEWGKGCSGRRDMGNFENGLP